METEQVVRELPEDERECPKCGKQLEEMKGQTEDSELIANIAAEYWKLLVMRQKYRCRCNASIVTAPGPTRVTPGGRYTASFATQVAVDKYVDHLPLERQVRIMKRAGLSIDSQTLWDQLNALAKHLQPTYEAIREYILGADVIGADETWWRLMKKKSNKKWYAWGLTTHDAAWYRLADSRSAEIAKEVLDGFEGTVVCDGYKAYETVQNSRSGVRLAHCWAHARRKFVEAEPNYPRPCGEALEMIGNCSRSRQRCRTSMVWAARKNAPPSRSGPASASKSRSRCWTNSTSGPSSRKHFRKADSAKRSTTC